MIHKSPDNRVPVRIENLMVSTPDSIRIFWEINLRCNYDCVNCPPDTHSTKAPFPQMELYKKSFTNLERLLASKQAIHWAFSGGEPLINPSIKEIFSEIIQDKFKSSSVEICTNLSLPHQRLTELFRPLYERFKNNTCIVATYHYPYTTPREFKEKIFQILEVLPETEFYPVLLLPTDPQKFNETVELFNDLKSRTKADLRMIRKNFGPDIIDYSEDQKKFMDQYYAEKKSERMDSLKLTYSDGSHEIIKSPPELMRRNMVNFKGWLCEAGFSEIVIDQDFRVQRASCAKGEDGMGLLYSDTFSLYDGAKACDKALCSCTPNICINKWKQ